MLTAAKHEVNARIGRFYMAHRKPGEIVEPATGEVIGGCVTIGKFAKALGTTTARLTKLMERIGLVHRVLTWKEVPLWSNPLLRKPDYYRTPEATPAAIRAGSVVQIKGRWGIGRRGSLRSMILVTPEGQRIVRAAFSLPVKPTNAVHARRESVERLHRQGRTPAEIVSMTGIARRTVFRHLGEIRKAA